MGGQNLNDFRWICLYNVNGSPLVISDIRVHVNWYSQHTSQQQVTHSDNVLHSIIRQLKPHVLKLARDSQNYKTSCVFTLMDTEHSHKQVLLLVFVEIPSKGTPWFLERSLIKRRHCYDDTECKWRQLQWYTSSRTIHNRASGIWNYSVLVYQVLEDWTCTWYAVSAEYEVKKPFSACYISIVEAPDVLNIQFFIVCESWFQRNYRNYIGRSGLALKVNTWMHRECAVWDSTESSRRWSKFLWMG